MATNSRLLDIAPSASSVRRQVGPTAWFVFEERAAGSNGAAPNGEVVATTRSLAEPLGLSKDTVARALTKLPVLGSSRRAKAVRPRARSARAATGSSCLVLFACSTTCRRRASTPPGRVTLPRRAAT